VQHQLELARTALSKRCRREELRDIAGVKVHAQKGRHGGARRPDLAPMGGGQLLDVAAKVRAVAARVIAAAAAAVGDGRGQLGRLCGGGLGLGPGVRCVRSRVQGQGQWSEGGARVRVRVTVKGLGPGVLGSGAPRVLGVAHRERRTRDVQELYYPRRDDEDAQGNGRGQALWGVAGGWSEGARGVWEHRLPSRDAPRRTTSRVR